MAQTYTFNPGWQSGVTISATTSSSRVQVGYGSSSIVVTNLGSAAVYVASGGSTVAATTASYPVLPGSQISLTKSEFDTHVAALAASGTVSVHVIPGEGF